MTKAGQAQMVKQGTPSASKVAAKRVAQSVGGSFPSMTRRYRATTFSIAFAGALAIAA